GIVKVKELDWLKDDLCTGVVVSLCGSMIIPELSRGPLQLVTRGNF
ncbi:METTL22 isoform 7, partial [Pan troglodytes]